MFSDISRDFVDRSYFFGPDSNSLFKKVWIRTISLGPPCLSRSGYDCKMAGGLTLLDIFHRHQYWN
jgi:hypothetical protein